MFKLFYSIKSALFNSDKYVNSHLIKTVLVLVINISFYLLFYYKLIFLGQYQIGTDLENYFYPIRYHIYQALSDGYFPFWTEKLFLGFPLYADPESNILNPLSLTLISIFGPFLSYKIQHVLIYLFGSYTFFLFLKKRNFTNIASFTTIFIYYFNFYFFYHSIHSTIIFVLYLLPSCLYFFERCLEKENKINLLIASLIVSVCLLFGSYQSNLFIIITLVLFSITHFKWDKSLKLILLVGWFALIISFPLLYSTYKLSLKSDRVDNSFYYSEGSFQPFMHLNTFIPFMLGKNDSYIGQKINEDYNQQEVSIYLGFSASIISLLYLFIIDKDNKINKFILFMIGTSIFLSYFTLIPIPEKINIPILSLFRYWGRSYILYIFAIALTNGYVISNIDKLSIRNKKAWSKLLLISILLISLITLSKESEEFKLFKQYLNNFDFRIIILLSINLLGFIFIYLLSKIKNNFKYKKYISLILFVFVLCDMGIFGTISLKQKIGSINYIFNKEWVQGPVNERVVIYPTPEKYYANKMLYTNSYSAVGYSPLKSDLYLKYLDSLGFSKTKETPEKISEENMKKLGIRYLCKNDFSNCIDRIDEDKIEIILGNPTGRYIKKEEGNIIFDADIKNSEDHILLLRNYPGWNIFVDGDRKNISTDKTGLFINIYLTEGSHVIEAKYTPYYFYEGIKLSLIFSIFSFVGFMGMRIIRSRNI